MRPLLWTLKALLSHYWRHPWQALFLLAGLVAGVALWSAVQVINGHAKASYSRANSMLGAQVDYSIRAADGGGVSQADYIALRREGWVQLYPVIESRVSTESGKLLAILATDLFALPNGLGAENLSFSGDGRGWLDFVQPPYQVWYPEALAQELAVSAGQQLALSSGRQLPPALIRQDESQGWQLLMDIGAALDLLERKDFSYLAVGEISGADAQALKSQLPNQLILEKNQQALDLEQLTQSLHTNLSAMSLLSFAVGLFIVFNAVRFSLWYRQMTVRNLRLMGVSLSTLGVALWLEALLWSLIASALGLTLGYLLSLQLLPALGATLGSLYGATVGSQILLQLPTLFIAWSMTLGGLLFALTWPMWRLSRQAVIPGSQLTAQWVSDTGARRVLLIAGLVLAIFAILLYPFISSILLGFTLLGLILFSAAWCLPWMLAFCLRQLSRLLPQERPLMRWIVSDGWAQLPTLRTAMMALLLALTCNLGVEALVDSFRTSFSGWLVQRLTADIYIRKQRPEIEALIQSGLTNGWLKASHQRIGIETKWRQRPTEIRGLDIDAPDTLVLPFAKALPDALSEWRTQATSQPLILANEQVHYLAGVALGDTVTLNTPSGKRDFTVNGFFYDYGNPSFQFYLPQKQMSALWPAAQLQGVALWLNPDIPVEAALQQAEQDLLSAGFNAGDWVTQQRVRETALAIFERTFAITMAMNTLTLLVAGLALLASLLAILQERLPQFAQWSALGVRLREQVWVISVPLLLFVGITWVLSIPLGALLSWLLINKLNVMSFGWSMPMLWSMQPALVLAALSLVVVVITLLITGLRLRRRLPQALAELGGGV